MTEQWYTRGFSKARDQTADPHIEELEEYVAQAPPITGKGVPLPTERLLREWEAVQDEERGRREARWREVTETYNQRARGGELRQGRRNGKEGKGGHRLAAIEKGALPKWPRVMEEEVEEVGGRRTSETREEEEVERKGETNELREDHLDEGKGGRKKGQKIGKERNWEARRHEGGMVTQLIRKASISGGHGAREPNGG